VEALAVAALGGLVLLAVAARLAASLGRHLAAAARRSARAASSTGRSLGVRGLLTMFAGTATALASAGSASATPAPVAAPHQHAAAAPRPASAPETYVVRPGDSLWAIASRHLGAGATNAQIAAEWPRWYRANRAAIGSDPSLIHVGTPLVVPSPRRTGTSASTHHRPAHRDPGRSALTLDPDRR
jgi:nucleoid-associated protein YgaU